MYRIYTESPHFLQIPRSAKFDKFFITRDLFGDLYDDLGIATQGVPDEFIPLSNHVFEFLGHCEQ